MAIRDSGYQTAVVEGQDFWDFGSEELVSLMTVTYDQDVDVLRIVLSDEDIDESDEDKPGIIIAYDDHGDVVGLEILNASTRMTDPRTLEYAVRG